MAHTFLDKSGATLSIRRAVEDDAPALIEFTKRVDAESPYLSREPGEFDMPVPVQRLFIKRTNEGRNSIVLVALHAGDLVGMVDFHGGTRQRALHTGEFGLSVRRDYWGRGLGGHLLDTLIAWARENGLTQKIKLRVQAGNEPAIALYRSRGFTVEGRLAREYRVADEWVDTLLMALWLERPEGRGSSVC